jgi:hypothetical protein
MTSAKSQRMVGPEILNAMAAMMLRCCGSVPSVRLVRVALPMTGRRKSCLGEEGRSASSCGPASA